MSYRGPIFSITWPYLPVVLLTYMSCSAARISSLLLANNPTSCRTCGNQQQVMVHVRGLRAMITHYRVCPSAHTQLPKLYSDTKNQHDARALLTHAEGVIASRTAQELLSFVLTFAFPVKHDTPCPGIAAATNRALPGSC